MDWHLSRYPSRAAADAVRGPTMTVVESFGQVWLSAIGDAGAWPSGGERVTELGPIPVRRGTSYAARFMEAVFPPGMQSVIHRHSGAEVWYTLSGETCLETSEGSMVGRAGGPPVMVPEGPPMQLTAIGNGCAQGSCSCCTMHRSPPPRRPRTGSPRGYVGGSQGGVRWQPIDRTTNLAQPDHSSAEPIGQSDIVVATRDLGRSRARVPHPFRNTISFSFRIASARPSTPWADIEDRMMRSTSFAPGEEPSSRRTESSGAATVSVAGRSSLRGPHPARRRDSAQRRVSRGPHA